MWHRGLIGAIDPEATDMPDPDASKMAFDATDTLLDATDTLRLDSILKGRTATQSRRALSKWLHAAQSVRYFWSGAVKFMRGNLMLTPRRSKSLIGLQVARYRRYGLQFSERIGAYARPLAEQQAEIVERV
jgi:hypothetical protein